MSIGSDQKKIIFNLQEEIKNQKNNNIDICSSAYSYVATWGDNLGLENIKYKRLNLSNFFKFNLIKLKDLFGVFKCNKYTLNNYNKKNYRKIIISSASQNNFNNKGSYKDRYLNINSNEHNDILFILVDTNIKNKKLDENILILSRKENNFIEGILFFLKSFFFYLIKNKKLKNFTHTFNFSTILAYRLQDQLDKVINFEKIETILLPYEGIPYQQNILRFFKLKNSKIRTIGYDHSAPHSVPIHLMYRDGAPDNLIINGKSQKEFMVHYLNWPEKKIKIAPSLRYLQNSNERFQNIIFFPWKIINFKKIIYNFENYLQNLPNKFLNHLEVKTHPIGLDPDIQYKLKNEIEILIKKNKKKFDQKIGKDISMFIGSTTGVIVALEKGIEVVHICFDSLFESYSENLWPNIEVNEINNNVFTYKLKNRNTFLTFGNDEETFKNYYIN